MLLNKEKISKIEVYDMKERHLGTTRIYSFAKSLFKTSTIGMTIKCKNLPNMKKGDSVMLVFEYVNSQRYRTVTRIDSASKTEIEVKVGEVTEIEERRRSFKIATKEKATVYKSKSEKEEGIEAMILNINLGGVLLKCDEYFNVGTIIYLNTFSGNLEVPAKILRRQNDINGNFVGYGCQFVDISETEEEIVAKYILECQVAERERRKTLEEMGMD
ncbi:MAG: PilZ domain-containing protein [Oscillospiraceae bacterium]|nr:PilZ domain-containing protein [Oscillospiraceae bacterium]